MTIKIQITSLYLQKRTNLYFLSLKIEKMDITFENATLLDLEQSERNGSYTYADYISWKFSETLELIKGKIYRMAAPSRRHQVV